MFLIPTVSYRSSIHALIRVCSTISLFQLVGIVKKSGDVLCASSWSQGDFSNVGFTFKYILTVLCLVQITFNLYRIPPYCGACTYIRNRCNGACTKSESICMKTCAWFYPFLVNHLSSKNWLHCISLLSQNVGDLRAVDWDWSVPGEKRNISCDTYM